MLVVRARFDGEKVILEREHPELPPGEVIVVFETGERETAAWMKAQEKAFAGAWDDGEDSVYDSL